ncbi:MAG TPA: crosslink repair DNA glycosylase YcaQ family protein, partial [Actinomycetes bacterium]|nr:crosslink repair DNA glycosylase YcaQ family protein [Actinomycetes bacterium]
TERLFGFRYRIEIYVPAEQRVFGYYVFPFLLDGALVGRVDLKADRKNKVLLVQSAWREDTAPPETAERLAGELHAMADWLELDHGVIVRPAGNLAFDLGEAITGQ